MNDLWAINSVKDVALGISAMGRDLWGQTLQQGHSLLEVYSDEWAEGI